MRKHPELPVPSSDFLPDDKHTLQPIRFVARIILSSMIYQILMPIVIKYILKGTLNTLNKKYVSLNAISEKYGMAFFRFTVIVQRKSAFMQILYKEPCCSLSHYKQRCCQRKIQRIILHVRLHFINSLKQIDAWQYFMRIHKPWQAGWTTCTFVNDVRPRNDWEQ